MIIRPFDEFDTHALLGLASSFATSFAVSEQRFRSSLRAVLADDSACLRVAQSEDGALAGYLLEFAHHTFYANGRVAWVEEIMVSEAGRRRGTGTLLMESFEQWALDRECRLIALATRRAAHFYEAIGYGESATYFRKLL